MVVAAVASTVVRVSKLCVLVGLLFFFRNRSTRLISKKKRAFQIRSVFKNRTLITYCIIRNNWILRSTTSNSEFPNDFRRSVLLGRDALEEERDRLGLLLSAK